MKATAAESFYEYSTQRRYQRETQVEFPVKTMVALKRDRLVKGVIGTDAEMQEYNNLLNGNTYSSGSLSEAKIQQMIDDAKLSNEPGEAIDMSNYLLKEEVPSKVNEVVASMNLATKQEIPTVPNKISQLTDDIGLAKTSQLPDVPKVVSALANDKDFITKPEADSEFAKKTQLTPIAAENVTRAFNTVFRPSTTRNMHCIYSVRATSSVVIGLGMTKRGVLLYLETSSDGATNWQVLDHSELSVESGVASTVSNTIVVSGVIKAGMYARIRQEGTGTAVYGSGKEMTV